MHGPPEQYKSVDSHNCHGTEKYRGAEAVRNNETTVVPIKRRQLVNMSCTMKINIRVGVCLNDQ